MLGPLVTPVDVEVAPPSPVVDVTLPLVLLASVVGWPPLPPAPPPPSSPQPLICSVPNKSSALSAGDRDAGKFPRGRNRESFDMIAKDSHKPLE
ncbi:hypothetical protein [Sorangium sp. So ce1099]|uniref:hypothetical protein n=1 Tax=Sorangium sp. So ce1099 TaxID=3133331 RepID=UPI003F62A654